MDEFYDKGYADFYYEKFIVYLGSTGRYLMNLKLRDIPYYG